MYKRAVCVMVVLVACGSREQVKQTSTAPSCASAIDALMKPYGQGSSQEERDVLGNARAKLTTRCNEDAWSDAARTCTSQVTRKEQLRECWRTTLTVAQYDSASRAVGELATDAGKQTLEQWYVTMERLKSEMCACEDYACTQRVEAKIDTSIENTRAGLEEPDTQRASALFKAIQECKRENPEALKRHDEAMAAMRRFKDQMCVCQDASCAQRVSDDMSAWSKAASARGGESAKMTEEDQEEAARLGEEMGRCMQRAFVANREHVARVHASMKRFKTRMCACKTAACAKKVSAEIEEWAPTTESVRRSMSDADRMTSDAIHEALEKCRRRLQPK